ncbi:FRG domain-containing protein [Vibrio splendidus]|uniref:FRG domain-containing protein n=1 Tax=Vibrio splendidus TaxID=29497 RepID=UPI0024698AEB|nr:FRG domain-containing protein [Vibrio splendidus]MDH5886539.1 FRG domain-containing protein [Vibrio splendidus]
MDGQNIEKLSQYMEYVEKLPKEFSLSRGQSKDYKLLPSALRKDEAGNRKYTRRAVNNFLTNFRVNSYQYMENPWDVNSDIEWMLHAQHYGIPTKLMDFTTSHITSLLFSVEKAFSDKDESDAVIYFLDPCALNSKNAKQSQIITVDGSDKIKSDEHDGPVAIQVRKLNSRINAQNGLFVLFQDADDELVKGLDEDIIKKVTIKGDAKRDILSSLYTMGVTFSNIYPELTSVAKDIVTQQDINEYLREQE